MADDSFGGAVRRARQARGWKQADLASRIGMSQRAVSNWERGTAEPEDAVKEKLRDVLGLRDPAAVSASTSDRIYPGRPLVTELPFEWLSPEQFEEFTKILLQELHPGASVTRVGKSGHDQGGYDVHVTADGRVVAAAQCKRVREFGPKDVRAAVDAVQSSVASGENEPVDASVITLSRVASPGARKELLKFPGWELWDRNDLSSRVRGLGSARAEPIVKQFFPTMLTDFLGVKRPGPWLDVAEYISLVNAGEVYSHRWRLVGRPDIVEELTDYAASNDGGVALLTGPGGSGKTKILTEVCAQSAQRGVAVRVLERDSEVMSESFEQLPDEGALLIVVDDAHDDTVPLGRIIAGVRKANPKANVLLSSRPYGMARIGEELQRLQLHLSETLQKQVVELDLEAAEELACEVLDESLRHQGLRLAAAARDCPLLIVTGAMLVNRGELDPRVFESDARLHDELSRLLPRALTTQSAIEVPVRRTVLTALAAYQPVDLADAQVRTSLERMTGLDFDQVSTHVSALEEAGVVLRRHATVRVVPDLLGDALLNQAARQQGAGVDTGYLSKARRYSAGAAMRNLIVNAGRVDWQAGAGAEGAGLVEPLWQEINDLFRSSDAFGRVDVLDVVAKVAFFQPRHALNLAAWAMQNPAAPATQRAAGYIRSVGDEDVRQALAPVLRPIAWHPSHFSAAAELLWRLAQDDARPPNQHPDHPLRVLSELASFTSRGLTDQQSTLVGLVGRWLERPQVCEGARSPLSLLSPLLATSGQDEQWKPDALVFHPFALVPAPAVLALRSRVLDLAFEQLACTRLAWAAEASAIIGAAFTLVPPAFGLTIDEQLQQAWFVHFAEVLRRLHGYVTEHQLSPALLVALRSRLQWTAEHGPGQLRRSAQAIVKEFPTTAENELARALHGGPVDPVDEPDLAARDQLRQRLFASCISSIADWPDEEVTEKISTLLRQERAVFGPDTGRARPFIWELITERPSVGPALCARAMAEPDNPVRALVSISLIAMGQAGAAETISLGDQLATNGDIELARHVAHAFGLQRSRNTLLPGEDELLRTLAGHPDSIVAAAAAGAAQHLATGHQELAVELLFAALPSAGLQEIARVFGQPYGMLSWNQLPEEQKSTVLHALTTCPSIDTYEISQFLAQLVHTDPARLIDVLQRRIEHAEQGGPAGFSPLPHVWNTTLPFGDSTQLPELLRQVREWLAAAPDSPWRVYLGSELFALVAGSFETQALDVIYDYVDTPDPMRMKVVAIMLRAAPRNLAWNVEAVRRILRAADQCGQESLNAVQAALVNAASHNPSPSLARGPFAEDAEHHDRAQTLAAACLPGSVEEQFYQDLAASAARSAGVWAALREATTPADDHRSWA